MRSVPCDDRTAPVAHPLGDHRAELVDRVAQQRRVEREIHGARSSHASGPRQSPRSARRRAASTSDGGGPSAVDLSRRASRVTPLARIWNPSASGSRATPRRCEPSPPKPSSRRGSRAFRARASWPRRRRAPTGTHAAKLASRHELALARLLDAASQRGPPASCTSPPRPIRAATLTPGNDRARLSASPRQRLEEEVVPLPPRHRGIRGSQRHQLLAVGAEPA